MQDAIKRDSGEKINWSKECECGNPKPNSSTMCSSCAFLDGQMPRMALIIDALRGQDGLTVNELCETIYGKAVHANTTGMQAILQKMCKSGRVRRFEREEDQEAGFGKTWTWVYCLTISGYRKGANKGL